MRLTNTKELTMVSGGVNDYTTLYLRAASLEIFCGFSLAVVSPIVALLLNTESDSTEYSCMLGIIGLLGLYPGYLLIQDGNARASKYYLTESGIYIVG